MAVTLNATGTADHSGSAVLTHDAVITVADGTNKALILQVIWDLSSPTGVTATWDPNGANQSMTLIKSDTLNGTNGLLQLWGLVNPTSAEAHVTISWTNASDVAAVAVAFDGVDQTGGETSFIPATSASGTGTTASITITSATGNETLDVSYNGGAAFSAPTQTNTITDNTFPVGSAAGSRAAGAATVTHSWTVGSSQAWKSIGVNVVAAGAEAGITYDNASSVAANAGSGGCSWSHTIGGGSDRVLLMALVFQEQESSPTTITATYDSVAMTAVGRFDSGQYDRTLALYIMKEADLPSAGSYTVAFSFGATEYYAGGGAVSFSNVDQTTAAHNYAEQYVEATVSQVATFTVTSAANEVAVAFMCAQCPETVTDNNTNRWNRWDASGTLQGHGGSSKAGAASTDFTWTFGGTSEQAYYNVGASLKDIAAPAGEDGFIEATRVYTP